MIPFIGSCFGATLAKPEIALKPWARARFLLTLTKPWTSQVSKSCSHPWFSNTCDKPFVPTAATRRLHVHIGMRSVCWVFSSKEGGKAAKSNIETVELSELFKINNSIFPSMIADEAWLLTRLDCWRGFTADEARLLTKLQNFNPFATQLAGNRMHRGRGLLAWLSWLTDRRTDGLNDWLADWLAGSLAGWLAGWRTDWLTD